MSKKGTIRIFAMLIAVLMVARLTDCGNSSQENIAHTNDTIPLTKYWEKAIPHQTIPVGLTSLSAKECGNCHQEIYNEWKHSTHAVAYQDLQFQAEWKSADIYACLNCHAPLQNQQEFIVKGLINGDYKTPVKEPNPHFDRTLQLESITCASCHVRDGNVIGTIGITNAPHKTVKDVEFLSEQVCLNCHNVVDELNPVLVCTFETGNEWNENWAIKEGKNCISCHMPETERPIFPGMGNRISHFHNFPGSGIPKFFGMDVEGLEALDIIDDTVKSAFNINDKLRYKVTLINSYAGHNVPTGDPERFFLITFKLIDKDGSKIVEEKQRIGEEWQWYPEAKKISDNNLKPLEKRSFVFEYDFRKKENMTLTAEVTKHRMTEENAEYNKILGDYPIYITIWKREYEITIR